MSLVKRSAFASLAGVTRAAISLACKKGLLLVRPDGKLDTNEPVNKAYLRKKEKSSKTIGCAHKPEINDSDGDLTDDSGDTGPLSNKDAKIYEEILFIRLKRAKYRGALVDRALISRLISKIYSVDSSQLLPLGDLVADEIVGVAGVKDKKIKKEIVEIIDDRVRGALRQSQQIINTFLLDIKEELVEN